MDFVTGILSLYVCVDKAVTICWINRRKFMFVGFLGIAEALVR